MKTVRITSLIAVAGLFLLSFVTSCRHNPTGPTNTDSTSHECCNGVIGMHVQDTNGHAISGASFGVTGPNNTSRSETTNGDGNAHVTGLCPGIYHIRIAKDGYNVEEFSDTLTCNDTVNQTRVLHSSTTTNHDCCNGSINLIVRDSATGALLTGGTATLYHGSQSLGSKTIGSQAIWTGLCPGEYWISLSKDGYHQKSIYLVHGDTLGCNDQREVHAYLSAVTSVPRDTCTNGRAYLSVHDSLSGAAISGATINVYHSGGSLDTTEYSTSQSVRIPAHGGLTPGSYRVTINKDGYHEAVVEFTISCNEEHSFSVALMPTTNANCCNAIFGIHVEDSIHSTAIQGASVTIYGNNQTIASGTTTDGGNFTADGICGHTTYTIRVSKDGYNLKYETVQVGDCTTYNETISLGAK